MTRDLSYACQAVVVQSLSHVQLFAIPWAVACQAAMAWDFPSKNTGVDCRVLLQGIFPNQGSNPHLLHWQVDSLPLSDAMANCKLPQLMIHSWLWQLWITTVLYFHITFFFFFAVSSEADHSPGRLSHLWLLSGRWLMETKGWEVQMWHAYLSTLCAGFHPCSFSS